MEITNSGKKHGESLNVREHNIHLNESFPVNWEYIKQTIDLRMK